MNENASVMTPAVENTASPASVPFSGEPGRIQVSCIDEDDMPFLSPRPFSFARKERTRTHWWSRSKSDRDFQTTDDFINYAVRSIRRVGYALILVSVLLLVVDGVLRHTFGL